MLLCWGHSCVLCWCCACVVSSHALGSVNSLRAAGTRVACTAWCSWVPGVCVCASNSSVHMPFCPLMIHHTNTHCLIHAAAMNCHTHTACVRTSPCHTRGGSAHVKCSCIMHSSDVLPVHCLTHTPFFSLTDSQGAVRDTSRDHEKRLESAEKYADLMKKRKDAEPVRTQSFPAFFSDLLVVFVAASS